MASPSTPSTPPPPPPPPPPASAPSPVILPRPPPAVSLPLTQTPAVVKPEPRPPDSLPPAPLAAPATYSITIPSCSAWFSLDKIDETERRCLPEFFDGKSASRNPKFYKYLRDSIVGRFRSNPTKKITLTEVRKVLIADVGSVRRVFDFLETWGLINYSPIVKKEKREVEEAAGEKKESSGPKKVCSNCRSACSMACFVTDKADIILCARCFVRGNYRPGLSTHDFRRVDISEETKTEWTDKETLHLLEAVLQYGEDWKKVAEHVGSRTEKDCVARFIKLPFGEQFLGLPEISTDGKNYENKDQDVVEAEGENVADQLLKRRRLTPLADTSNPIMAQVAFLSAMVGPEVAEAAARAATAALYDVDVADCLGNGFTADGTAEREPFTANGHVRAKAYREAAREAKSQLAKERGGVEQSISDIIEFQMKEIREKIVNFEELELQMEKERVQLQQMRDLFFADQMNLLQHKAQLLTPQSGGGMKIKTTNDVT